MAHRLKKGTFINPYHHVATINHAQN